MYLIKVSGVVADFMDICFDMIKINFLKCFATIYTDIHLSNH